jgi:hypothetical protein
MTASMTRFPPSRRAAAMLALVLAGVTLSGCAGMGDGFMSGAFVDPALYDYYDCKQLQDQRKSLNNRASELQALIDKANTGTGGAVVGEIAYRNDFITARAQLKLLEANWRRNKCVEVPDKPAAAPIAIAPPPKQKRAHSSAQSIGAVH